jgi:hypothetical protein
MLCTDNSVAFLSIWFWNVRVASFPLRLIHPNNCLRISGQTFLRRLLLQLTPLIFRAGDRRQQHGQLRLATFPSSLVHSSWSSISLFAVTGKFTSFAFD